MPSRTKVDRPSKKPLNTAAIARASVPAINAPSATPLSIHETKPACVRARDSVSRFVTSAFSVDGRTGARFNT